MQAEPNNDVAILTEALLVCKQALEITSPESGDLSAIQANCASILRTLAECTGQWRYLDDAIELLREATRLADARTLVGQEI
jgi:hypothetical protein